MKEMPKAYTDGINKINETVNEACKKAGHDKVLVIFSVYSLEGKEMRPNYNFNQIPLHGKFTIKDEGNFWGDIGDGEYGKDYKSFSKKMESPTWLELAVACNEMIMRTKDTHHVYFEGLAINNDGSIRFVTGS